MPFPESTRRDGCVDTQARRVAVQHQVTLAGTLGLLADPVDFTDPAEAQEELEVLAIMCQDAQGEALTRALLEVAGHVQMWLGALAGERSR